MNERVKCIARYLEHEDDFCDRTCTSRKTGYNWVERDEASGVPRGSTHALSPATIDAILAPAASAMGPRKLLAGVRQRGPIGSVPRQTRPTAHPQPSLILRRRQRLDAPRALRPHALVLIRADALHERDQRKDGEEHDGDQPE